VAETDGTPTRGGNGRTGTPGQTALQAVILFDIDGTLITSDGAGTAALERAVALALGRPREPAGFSFAGMTDRAILRRILLERGCEPTEEAIQTVLAVYPEVLAEEVARAARYQVHAGMQECLRAVSGLPGVEVGLGTGNVERGARIKLARVGLNGFFAFGGFGCDDEDRAELLRIGAARGAARLGRDLEGCRVVVVGDTPRDVAAAHAIGARCLAVATGGASVETLARTRADHLVESMAAPGALDALLALLD
jgi:phosphoglycolate phosphatase-like HAD superfamily hydrolase